MGKPFRVKVSSLNRSVKNPRESPNTSSSIRRSPDKGRSTTFKDTLRWWSWRLRLQGDWDARALAEVGAIRAVGVAGGKQQQLLMIDVALEVRDFLDTGDLEALAQLERLHELRRRQQRVVRAAVEPRHTTAEHLDAQVAATEILE